MQRTKLPDPNPSELKQPQCRPVHRLMKEYRQQGLAESVGLGSWLVSKTGQKRTNLPHARRPTAQALLYAASARRQSSVAQPVNTWWSFATAVEGFCSGVIGLAEAQMGLATGTCCGERQEPA